MLRSTDTLYMCLVGLL